MGGWGGRNRWKERAASQQLGSQAAVSGGSSGHRAGEDGCSLFGIELVLGEGGGRAYLAVVMVRAVRALDVFTPSGHVALADNDCLERLGFTSINFNPFTPPFPNCRPEPVGPLS